MSRLQIATSAMYFDLNSTSMLYTHHLCSCTCTYRPAMEPSEVDGSLAPPSECGLYRPAQLRLEKETPVLCRMLLTQTTWALWEAGRKVLDELERGNFIFMSEGYTSTLTSISLLSLMSTHAKGYHKWRWLCREPISGGWDRWCPTSSTINQ